MKNRIIISLFLLAAFCATPVFAQKNSKIEKPNFNGIWETGLSVFYRFDTTTQLTKTSVKLLIEQDEQIFKTSLIQISKHFDENEILIRKEEKVRPSWIFYLDARGETNLDEDNESFESSTKWDGKKIVITYKLKNEEDRYLVSEYSLSKKEDLLTIFSIMFEKQNNPKNDKKLKPVPVWRGITHYKKFIE